MKVSKIREQDHQLLFYCNLEGAVTDLDRGITNACAFHKFPRLFINLHHDSLNPYAMVTPVQDQHVEVEGLRLAVVRYYLIVECGCHKMDKQEEDALPAR